MNTSDYLTECLTHLSSETYKLVNTHPTLLLERHLKNIIYKFKNEITNGHSHKLFNFLLPKTGHRIPRFYGLPKIHKLTAETDIPPVRPNISHINSLLSNSARFIDHCLQPLAKYYPDYLENSTELIRKLSAFHITENISLVTMNIVSLYPSIPQKECLTIIYEEMCLHRELLVFSPNLMIQLLEFNMLNNYFEFGSFNFLQTKGIAMGAAFAPTVANIFMSSLLKRFMENQINKPLLIVRYIDDIFLIWPSNHNLTKFVSDINKFHQNIRFTIEHSSKSINFLDITIFKGHLFRQTQLLDIKTFQKPNNLFQYLHFNSFHPKNTFSSIITGECIRYVRTNTDKDNYVTQTMLLKSRLQKRGYPPKFISKYIDLVNYNQRQAILEESTKYQIKVNTHRPIFKCVPPPQFEQLKNITMHHWKLIKTNMKPPLFITKKQRTIGNHLVKSNYIPSDEDIIDIYLSCTPPSYNNTVTINTSTQSIHNFNQLREIVAHDIQPKVCNQRRCATCLHFNPIPFFKSTTNHTNYNIRKSFTCSSSNIIYLITCRKCKKQYIGKTTKALRERINHHRSTIMTNQNRYLSIHFNFPDHNINHLSVQVIDEVDNQTDLPDLEKYWIVKLGTLKPKGLNFTL